MYKLSNILKIVLHFNILVCLSSFCQCLIVLYGANFLEEKKHYFCKIMQHIKTFFRLLWRVWFALLAGIPIIVFAPLILISIVFDIQWLFTFFKYIWANFILFFMGFWTKVDYQTKVDKKRSYIMIANHTSILDIFVNLKLFRKPFVFVGKASLSKLPIFGYLYKKSNVMVDRNSPRSKKEVINQVEHFVVKGNSICIYPEGGIPEDTSIVLGRFKTGAFRMAIENQLPILPMLFFDNKTKFPYSLFKGFPGRLNVKILPVIETKGLTFDDLNSLVEYTYTIMYNELMNYQIAQKFDKQK